MLSLAGAVTLLLVLFQHGARSHFFRPFPISPGPLSAFFDVFILAFLSLADSFNALSSRHIDRSNLSPIAQSARRLISFSARSQVQPNAHL